MLRTIRSEFYSLTLIPALGLGLAMGACNGGGDDDSAAGPGCVGAKCDNPAGDDEPEGGEQTNFDGLRDFSDPIAVWLASNSDANGIVRADYVDMLTAVGEIQGCGVEGIDSYVISDALVSGDGTAFPRIVNTVCSNDRTKADMAFFALSFANEEGTDVDPRNVEMFSWDPKARSYRFYKMEPVEGDANAMQLTIQPEECGDCHGTASNIDGSFMHMLPIMNELSAPWEHWHASPISTSFSVDPAVKAAPDFSRIAGDDSPFLKSAARLETTVRSAFGQRVAIARLRTRRVKPAVPEQAMSLLRPLFCDEHLTYVTEDGASGLLASSAVVDNGLHSAYFAVTGTGWAWEWWNDRVLRLSPPGAPDAVNMLPVRGEAMVIYEKQLMASRGLKATQVMQIRALDWGNPAVSQFRCDLWHKAAERIEANPPEVTDTTRNSHLFDGMLDEILTIVPADHGLSGDLPARIPITSGDSDSVVSLRSADDSLQALAEALAQGTLDASNCEGDGEGACVLSPNELGEVIETHFKGVENGGRDSLNAERERRGCVAKLFYPNQPFIPGLPSEAECESLLGADATPDPDPDPDPDPTDGDSGDSGDSGDTGGEPVGAGNCCEPHAEAGCESAAVEACVCAMDEFCCDSEWDDTCVSEVASFGCSDACE